jgi:stage III sporulation protein SpoIIIAA
MNPNFDEAVYADIELLLDTLPNQISDSITDIDTLIEIVVDLGRFVEFRYENDSAYETDILTDRKLINDILSNLSKPNIDNRCGIDGTLHRISVIVNRNEDIIGLTIRIGKPHVGNAKLIEDLLHEGKSLLIVGPPGVGKTSLLREAAKILSVEMQKRVVIVDTSNEIAGEGDVPHLAVGKSRRLQVPRSKNQHEVMIEAVENHMPQVIIVDEVSTNTESLAAQTISQRGVQIIVTAHGNTIEDIIRNKSISELIGGVKTVTLTDEMATKRGTQKTIQEREGNPPFDCIVEIHSHDEIAIHHSTTAVVDAFLTGKKITPETRRIVNGRILKLSEPKIEVKNEETNTFEMFSEPNRESFERRRSNRFSTEESKSPKKNFRRRK